MTDSLQKRLREESIHGESFGSKRQGAKTGRERADVVFCRGISGLREEGVRQGEIYLANGPGSEVKMALDQFAELFAIFFFHVEEFNAVALGTELWYAGVGE